MSQKQKSCLIISYGPVPTPQYQIVEGGGMRVWGLATGLKQNGIDVTVAVNESFPQNDNAIDGINLVNWRLGSDFTQLINSFDSVIVSYNAGDLSVFVAEHINDDVQLILDAYVPIYIEVSAREAKDIDVEYVNYAADLQRHNFTLQRGDYFLTANEAQDTLYTGVLSALGIINPYSYREKRIIRTPFGIHDTPVLVTSDPYKALGISSKDFVVLWFGGIYPWFRIEEYLASIKKLSKDAAIHFVFVGGKNPFNPNPDLARQYDTAVNFAKKESLLDKQVHFVDWVDYDTRANWYKRANIVVSINQPGEENKYSWRTRVMDFVWGDAVILTNGGDPLSEELVERKAAIKIDNLTESDITASILNVKSKPSLIQQARKNLALLRAKYYWHNVTQEIAGIIALHELPFAKESALRLSLPQTPPAAAEIQPSKLKRIVKLPAKVIRYAKRKGVVRTFRVAYTSTLARLKTQLKREAGQRESQFVFISHPINNTGAPIVLLEIIEEYVNKYGSSRVRVIAPSVEKEQKAHLRKLGITVEHAVFGAGFRPIRLQLGLRKDDFVLINTIAIYDNYRDFIMLWLKLGRLSHAHWFIHEDKAQIPIIHKEFLDAGNISQIKKLVSSKKLSLYFPSRRTANEYEDLLGIDNLRSIKLHVDVEKKYKKRRPASDFENLNFLISGTASDGRKGQLLALAAFQHFLDTSYRKQPEQYRDFTLHLVAVGKDDYISQQIRWIGDSMLGNKVKIYEPMPKDKALEITAQCNVVICASLNETFGLYIAEAMHMGHVVLRNNSAGVDEQLIDGKNGYLINHTNIRSLALVIEKILNKNKPNADLQRMGVRSQDIIGKYTDCSYLEQMS